MTIQFYKYQGTGNDFVLIDNRDGVINLSVKQVKFICDRRFGIGADGLILLQNHATYDFEMIYYNADGNESTMCGNGGRCIIAFASYLSVIKQKCNFLAIDGVHKGIIDGDTISIQMSDVDTIDIKKGDHFLDTGSPHYVTFVDDVSAIDVADLGSKIRNNTRFKTEGTNVNFITPLTDGLKIRTYERGVEAETLSCGTGATACAIIGNLTHKMPSPIRLETEGGNLTVSFNTEASTYTNIWLSGPAVSIFSGKIDV